MIHVRGKDMLFIEAHGHVWQKLHGIRFNYHKLQSIGYGMIKIGGEEYLFVPPEMKDNSCPIEA